MAGDWKRYQVATVSNYCVTWQSDLFGEGAVVRSHGRKGGANRILSLSFDSLETAWPFIRRTIKARLRQ